MYDWITQVLRERREAAGLTLAHMEHTIGYDRGNLSKLERGLIRALRDLDGVVAGYAKALDVHPTALWREALERWEADVSKRTRRRRKSQT